jgi:enamine deaminase RidA (YjgF/YER057c/UK114 family)
MAGRSGRWWFPVACCALLLLTAGPGRAEEPKLAISGYDPVAYFTDGKPVPGRSEFEYTWHNARWRFASVAHRDTFASNPDRYAPQYDGYCSMGVTGVSFAAPHKDTVDPEAWAIVDGKLYLTHTPGSMERWRENAAGNIKQADQNWKFVKDQAEPMVVGPPCGASPPTVIITTSDGKRELLVGKQVALDGESKVVGKGDMRAQIEQVSKNLDACLNAAGASKAKIFRTETFVSNKAEFLKHADVWTKYLGPVRLDSATVEEQHLKSPDTLVEIQAVALLN